MQKSVNTKKLNGLNFYNYYIIQIRRKNINKHKKHI